MFHSGPGMMVMICAGIFAGITNYSHAQYLGPGSSSKSADSSSSRLKDRLKSAPGEESGKDAVTVRELKKAPVYDENVTIRGKLARKTDSKIYRFQDDTGTMNVTIEDSLFKNRAISETTVVQITGRLNKSGKSLFKEPDFRAKSLKAVKS